MSLSGLDLGIPAAQVQLRDLIGKIDSFVAALPLSEPDANGKMGTVCAGEATFCQLVRSFCRRALQIFRPLSALACRATSFDPPWSWGTRQTGGCRAAGTCCHPFNLGLGDRCVLMPKAVSGPQDLVPGAGPSPVPKTGSETQNVLKGVTSSLSSSSLWLPDV